MFDFLRRASWPDFLIIGAQKAGTSALHELLAQHPCVMHRPSEVHFFDAHYELGTRWYRAQFPRKRKKGMIVGDKTPYYLYHPLVPKRAHALLPYAKLIVLLRNPVDRAYSQYWMNRRKNQEDLSFSEAVNAEAERLNGVEEKILSTGISEPFSSHRFHSYLARGRYLEQIERWLSYYSPKQMKILFYENLRDDPKSVMKEILPFLGLPEFDQFDYKVGETHSYPPMDPELRDRLNEYFRPHNERLEIFLKLKNWRGQLRFFGGTVYHSLMSGP